MKKYEVTVTLTKTWKEEVEAKSITEAQLIVSEKKDELLAECSVNKYLENYDVETMLEEKK